MLAFLIKISAIIVEGDFVAALSLQLNANLSVLFTDSPFEERFAGAAGADFRGIACLPRWEREFRDGVEQGIVYARCLQTLDEVSQASARALQKRSSSG